MPLLRSSCCLASNEAQSDGRSRRYSCCASSWLVAASAFETRVSSALTFAHRRSRNSEARDIHVVFEPLNSEHILHKLSSGSSSKLKQGEQLPGRENSSVYEVLLST
uniref:Uncharacterized protein n=1 Tax=Trichogramma kaykai TaxID=54128 RepID=A0ABD2WY01_9HYME